MHHETLYPTICGIADHHLHNYGATLSKIAAIARLCGDPPPVGARPPSRPVRVGRRWDCNSPPLYLLVVLMHEAAQQAHIRTLLRHTAYGRAALGCRDEALIHCQYVQQSDEDDKVVVTLEERSSHYSLVFEHFGRRIACSVSGCFPLRTHSLDPRNPQGGRGTLLSPDWSAVTDPTCTACASTKKTFNCNRSVLRQLSFVAVRQCERRPKILYVSNTTSYNSIFFLADPSVSLSLSASRLRLKLDDITMLYGRPSLQF